MLYKIVVDKQSKVNPSPDKKTYEVNIEELRALGDVYDSLVITKDETYVMRKLVCSEFHVLSVLPEPIKQPLTEVNIQLFEGDNYIYLIDMEGNRFYAEYLIKNEFNDLYVIQSQMQSAINQSASQIEFSVNQKLTEYSTTDEMNSAISVSADNITSTVERTLQNYDTTSDVNTKITTAKSEIKQTTDAITSTVSTKVGNNEVISKINQSSEAVTIDANKINLNGKTINMTSDNIAIQSTNFNVDKNGNMSCSNANINGSVTSNNVNITGGKVNLTGGTPELSIRGTDLYGDTCKNYIMSDGMRINNETYGFSPIYIADSSTSEGRSGAITVKNVYNNSVSMDGSGISVTEYSTGKQTTVKSGEVRSPKLTQTSLATEKKNFEKMGNNALDIIKNIDIYKYNLRFEKDTDKKHIGFVIGDNFKYSKEITSIDNKGVDNYSFISLCCKAIQEQQEQIEQLQNQIKEMKGE